MSKGSGETPVIEVEFAVPADYPLTSTSREAGCRLELAAMVPRPDERYAQFFTVIDGDPARIADRAAEHDRVVARHMRTYETGGLVEFLVSGPFPAYSLATVGALPREIDCIDGEGRIVAEIPPQYGSADVIEGFLAEYSEATLATKREKSSIRPLYTRSTFQQVVQCRLTDRQREVLETAYEAGFYEWPREVTGEEVAEKLGISSATFSEHMAAAERKLLAVTFEGPE